jgi:hypothetical protein
MLFALWLIWVSGTTRELPKSAPSTASIPAKWLRARLRLLARQKARPNTHFCACRPDLRRGPELRRISASRPRNELRHPRQRLARQREHGAAHPRLDKNKNGRALRKPSLVGADRSARGAG